MQLEELVASFVNGFLTPLFKANKLGKEDFKWVSRKSGQQGSGGEQRKACGGLHEPGARSQDQEACGGIHQGPQTRRHLKNCRLHTQFWRHGQEAKAFKDCRYLHDHHRKALDAAVFV